MNFDLTMEQQMIADTAADIAKQYGPEYWREKDDNKAYPIEFMNEIGSLGFFGLPLEEKWGGAAAGLTDVALAMEALCRGGGGGGPALGYLFGLLGTLSVSHHANDAQKQKYLPAFAAGEKTCAFALSEPNAGTNSLNIETFAEKDGDDYIINGGKWFITNIDNTDAVLIVARTSKKEDVKNKAVGISLFLVDLPCEGITYTPIDKQGYHYYKSFQVFFDNVRVSKECLLGEEGKGFYHLLGTLNPERILIASGAVGTAKLALQHAIEYAKERNVFGQPIGGHQAVQHPLAAAYAKVEAAWGQVLKAATLFDQGKPDKEVGDVANMAKYLAAESALDATYHAMQTLGGCGFAREYHVERWFRECQLFRLAPVTQQMTLNYLGEHVLGLPRSY
ncbi:acyl-CoA dehydrogenase family protein [Thalassotalea sp. Y01]|uniref:acyl-CoA dehydrogenase family protein n=1 Tax=Thalassotalea sp. Y01 TaxID=2729613 RepID=UPI00145F683D|nr:acyl-CoA dehydrogenase family protein [Thalassotalea sp. Y01]NMP14748.1 acyl-CoA/acyl-ACP dehydrogenase [Thalassotalea sp. Y01]